MLRNISIPYKPLCMIQKDNIIYIGDARGNILILNSPYYQYKMISLADSPISAIFNHDGLYYGTWDGIVGFGERNIKIGKNMIKAIYVYKDNLFASVDNNLVILDLQLNIIKEFNLPHKIHCIDRIDEKIVFGMSCGFISSFESSLEDIRMSAHESTILSIKGNITGSTDGTIRDNIGLINKTSGWIRSIYDKTLYSSGCDVIMEGNIIYKHEDEITGICKIEDLVISIGLDCCIKIYGSQKFSDAEEEELLNLLNE